MKSGAYELSKAANEYETQFHEKLNYVMTFDRRLSCAYVIYEVSGKFKFTKDCLHPMFLYSPWDKDASNGNKTQQ